MKKYNVLCLDDDEAVSSLVESLNKKATNVHIGLQFPKPFSLQIDEIIALDKKSSLDGLLLDLRLDQTCSEDNEPANYRAASLAQEVRTLATEKRISAFPIFLWSIDTKLSKSFSKDNSSQDLFDAIFLKDSFPKNATVASRQIESVVKAFKDIAASLKQSTSFVKLLNIKAKSTAFLDPRIGEDYLRSPKSVPIHAFANYILSQIIQVPGPLIDESLLCARLGIDAANSPDFSKLLKMIDAKTRYQGPFGDAWERWWWQPVEVWWSGLKANVKPMTSLPASARVDILKETLGLKRLEVAKAIGDDYGCYFSTVCQILKKPLDPMDGFIIAPSAKQPWQEKSYISRETALNRAKYGVLYDLDPLENERLQSFKKRK